MTDLSVLTDAKYKTIHEHFIIIIKMILAQKAYCQFQKLRKWLISLYISSALQ